MFGDSCCELISFTFFFLLSCGPGVRAAVDTHPKYARVQGNIETVWQRPATTPKGILFIAHGCQHQGTDIFSDVGPDGWVFKECSSSNFGRCLGLPEEVSLRREARSRGYVVMAVSGGSGLKSCWHGRLDVPKVASAIRHVQEAEELAPDVPVLAIGASSGGAFVGLLAAKVQSGGVKNLKCIVPQIMGIQSGINRGVPTLFVHMPRDRYTAHSVEANMQDLRSRGIRAAEIRVQPVAVTTKLLEQCLSVNEAESVLRSMKANGLLDDRGFLENDPRMRDWVEPVQNAMSKNSIDTLEPDESCLAELMNVAWAQHEFTAQYACEMLDFCEESGTTIGTHPTITTQSIDRRESSWKTFLGELKVQEFGQPDWPLAVALHGMSSKEQVIHEWDAVAGRLSGIGYHVLVPNWHSNPRTKPEVVGLEQLASVMRELMKAANADKVTLLLGKSWGGGMAANLATDPSLQVQQLVLVAPAGLSNGKQWRVTCRTALFWAQDDPVISISTAKRIPGLLHSVELFHEEHSGGHRVLPAYIEFIARFAKNLSRQSRPTFGSGSSCNAMGSTEQSKDEDTSVEAVVNSETFSKTFSIVAVGSVLLLLCVGYRLYRSSTAVVAWTNSISKGRVIGAVE